MSVPFSFPTNRGNRTERTSEVHESCRKNLVNKKRIRQFLTNKENITPIHEKRKHRSNNDTCLFCHQEIIHE